MNMYADLTDKERKKKLAEIIYKTINDIRKSEWINNKNIKKDELQRRLPKDN